MKIYDISWPIQHDMTEYKNTKSAHINQVKTFESHGVRLSQFSWLSHTGTHVDAPSHFLQDGYSIDQIEVSKLIGPCRVLDCTHISQSITSADLQSFDVKKEEIILLKTKNSFLSNNAPFDSNFIYLHETAAQYLADLKIKSVGIDYLGIERNQPEHPTHQILMHNNILIIEGLRLENISPGLYTLYCLPLLIPEADAAPARAILIES